MQLENLHECPFCIYGAGIIATSVYAAMQNLYGCSPLFFLVSDPGITELNEEHKIDGILVKSLSEWKAELRNLAEQEFKYLIAAPEVHHATIVEGLRELQIRDDSMILVTGSLENKLMEAYFSNLQKHTTIAQILVDYNKDGSAAGSEVDRRAMLAGTDNVQVYQVKSHVDKPLQSQHVFPVYVHSIQAGAGLTNQIISTLRDNRGDNISAKNRNYCELTATYYAWKNSNALYKGICHYRRLFDISEEQMLNLLICEMEWDVILPYPSVHYPNISTQHTRYIKESDWNAMLQALGELEPEYLKFYEMSVANDEQYFFNFNMLIAKAAVFDDYCSFLFRILERTEELVTPRGWERADRFAGYLGENLTTIYFLKNRERWKIAYAGKTWLI
mgnify:CR=1 FL=1